MRFVQDFIIIFVLPAPQGAVTNVCLLVLSISISESGYLTFFPLYISTFGDIKKLFIIASLTSLCGYADAKWSAIMNNPLY